MGYEIEFVGVNEKTKDADALVVHWDYGPFDEVLGVYDGGVNAYGERLSKLLDDYYFTDSTNKRLDFVICSHSDLDHASGLSVILNKYSVSALYMNRPWIYADELFPYVNDGRITKESLIRRLKEKYQYIATLEEIAEQKGIPIYEVFAGKLIKERLRVCSPTKEFYLSLLIESEKTPLEEKSLSEGFLQRFIDKALSVLEDWNYETLRENVTTSAENEMSIVVYGIMDEEKFLLTADAGLRGLGYAMDYLEAMGVSVKNDVSFVQIPHHGGRHNVSPSLLNRMLGSIVAKGTTRNKLAYVSAAKDSDHPLKMVTNAFLRRGLTVYKTNGQPLRHRRNMPDRPNYTNADTVHFEKYVEEWDD